MVEGVPEIGILRVVELGVEGREVLHCFREGAATRWAFVGFAGDEDVGWKEREAEREVGRGEDCEGLDEDVVDGLVAGEVWIELVSSQNMRVSDSFSILVSLRVEYVCGQDFQIELIYVDFTGLFRALG